MSASSRARRRSSRPPTPASNATVSDGDERTIRPMSQKAKDGEAESTPPMPATRVMARVGSPMAVHTPWITPSGTVEQYVMKRCSANRRRSSGAWLRNHATSSASENVEKSGRLARSAAILRWSASRSGSSEVLKIHPSVAWIASVLLGSSSPGASS